MALDSVDLEHRPGRAGGAARPQRGGQDHARSRAPAACCGPTAGAVTVYGAPAGSSAALARIGYLAELFRFPGWLSAEEVLELHQGLTGSRAGQAERLSLLEQVGLAEARGGEGRLDVEGHAAAAGHRPGAGGHPAPAAARRARERAGPGRAPGDPGAAALAAPARDQRPAELAPAQRGGAGLRPRRAAGERPRGPQRPPGRPRAPARGGGRDRGAARGYGRAPPASTCPRSCPSWWPPASRSTGCACWPPRSRTSTSRRWGRDRLRHRGALRDPGERAPPGVPGGAGAHRLVRRRLHRRGRGDLRRPGRLRHRGRASAPPWAPACSASRCSWCCSSAPRWPSS